MDRVLNLVILVVLVTAGAGASVLRHGWLLVLASGLVPFGLLLSGVTSDQDEIDFLLVLTFGLPTLTLIGYVGGKLVTKQLTPRWRPRKIA